MKKILYLIITVMLLGVTPAFAEAHNLIGCWNATEIFYKNISIPVGNDSEISDRLLSVTLVISEDNTCSLSINNIVYSSVIYGDKNGNYKLTIANDDLSVNIICEGIISVVISEDLIAFFEKSNNKPNYSGTKRIEDILKEEDKQEDFLRAKAEAEAAALAEIKPASVYDMHVAFSKVETSKMSLFMNYGRYYLDGNTMIGMAYDKSGFLPNLVKCTIVKEADSPVQEVFTVLDRHVNANFLTEYNNQLFYIRVDRDSGLSSLARLDLDTEKIILFGPEMREMAYLQFHDDRLWYTGDGHHLYSCLLNGSDNRVELNKAVYDPYFLTKDWLIYQDDADGETLHLRFIENGTDLKITETRSFNPIVDGSFLYFSSIPDDGGKAYLSRIDLNTPLKDGDLCYKIESSMLPMSRSFGIYDSIIYAENLSSVEVFDWKNLTNNAWLTITQRYFYVGDPYIIYGEIYPEHATVSRLYLFDKNTELKSLFRHVY